MNNITKEYILTNYGNLEITPRVIGEKIILFSHRGDDIVIDLFINYSATFEKPFSLCNFKKICDLDFIEAWVSRLGFTEFYYTN